MYEQPYSHREHYRSGSTLKTWTVGLMITGLVLEGFSVAGEWLAVAMFPNWNDPNAEIEDNELIFALGLVCSGLVLICLFVAGVVFFMMFIFRCAKNCRALGAENMEMSPGWCVGWFFIPIANLFMPYKGVKEIYMASDPKSDAVSWKRVAVSSLLPAWWAFWIISNIVSQVEFRLAMQDSVELVQASTYITLISFPLSIVSTILAIMIIRTLHERLEQKAQVFYSETAQSDPFAGDLPCPACGYDLRGTIASGGRSCPECGHILPA